MSAPSGLVVVDKPAGWTSHDVVAKVRRLAGTRKVGHAGTLDPMATGVLVLGVERATRLLTFLVGADKTYTATIRLGVSTLTDDAEGEVTATAGAAAPAVTDERIKLAVRRLTGPIQQVPSAVSAIKVDGRRAYARVRAGEQVELKARPVTVHRFDILQFHRDRTHLTHPDPADHPHSADHPLPPTPVVDLDVRVEVSSGTYVRALARDLGADLGLGGHLTALRRTRVGPYSIELARTLDALAQEFALLPLAEAARAAFPVCELEAGAAGRLANGQRVPAPAGLEAVDAEHPAAAFGPDGALVALVARTAGGLIRPTLVIPAD